MNLQTFINSLLQIIRFSFFSKIIQNRILSGLNINDIDLVLKEMSIVDKLVDLECGTHDDKPQWEILEIGASSFQLMDGKFEPDVDDSGEKA